MRNYCASSSNIGHNFQPKSTQELDFPVAPHQPAFIEVLFVPLQEPLNIGNRQSLSLEETSHLLLEHDDSPGLLEGLHLVVDVHHLLDVLLGEVGVGSARPLVSHAERSCVITDNLAAHSKVEDSLVGLQTGPYVEGLEELLYQQDAVLVVHVPGDAALLGAGGVYTDVLQEPFL